MTFDEVLAQVLELLQREKRLSYRALKARFQLDDDLLEAVKDELIYAKKLAVDEENRVLVWVGEQATVAPPPPAPFTPEAIRTRTFETLRHMSLKGSQQRLLIVELEDLHWCDHTSEDYLTSLVESLAGASIMLLTTYRPGYRPPWIDRSYATQISSQKYVALGLALHGKIAAKLGGTEAAGSELQRAFTLADQLQSPSLLYPIAHDFGHWHESTGKERAAATLYGKAKATIEQMLTAVEDKTLRSTFLQSALVQEIYERAARLGG